jgi:DNA-binding NarL/FixJ family response regulator
MQSKIKIIIVDDHPEFREVMKFLIEREGIGEVIAEAENGKVFLDLLGKFNPDLVLMDIEMPVMAGVEATREAKKIRPGIKVLAITMFHGKENCDRMIQAGALGVVLKTSGKQEIEKAIKTVLKGERFLCDL